MQEPTKTTSTATSLSGVPASRPMYSRARRAALRSDSSTNSSGSGTTLFSGAPWPGLVPQVTKGWMLEASMWITVSYSAPSSDPSVRQYSTAASQSAPCGACSRPFRYSKVVSSGAIMPALAPHSIDMLQMVIRPSMESLRMASPRYSTMWPLPPPVPVWVMSARIRSLADASECSSPSTTTAIVFGRACGSVCVASTCSTSLVPMPKASAPNAPCVAVCESPHTIVVPGWVSPSCGPITWTMPCSTLPSERICTPNSAQFLRRVSICVRDTVSRIVIRSPRRLLNAGSAYPVGVL